MDTQDCLGAFMLVSLLPNSADFPISKPRSTSEWQSGDSSASVSGPVRKMEAKTKPVQKRERTPEKPDENARLSTEAVRVIAQSVPNLPPISDTAAATLASDAEYRLRQIIQEGVKFMKHSKFPHLLPTHINTALRVLNVEPVYGFGTKRRKLNPAAYAFNTRERLGKSSGPSAGATSAVPHAAQFNQVDGAPDLFFLEDSEVSVKSLLEIPPPVVPLEVTVNAHWLAVDGSQPSISQNPVKQSQKLVQEHQGSDPQRVGNGTTLIEVKPPLKHDLTRELQFYFGHVKDALFGGDADQVQAILDSVARDKGISVLLPYLTQFIKDTVEKFIRDLPVLFSVMRLVKAILENDVFTELDRYLHQLLPAVISCLVGKRLCRNPRDDHWALRDYTARLIQKICSKYTKGYVKVQQRITKTFVDALQDVNRPLTTHYGSTIGLACLGRHVVDAMLLPLLSTYMPKIKRLLEDPGQKSVRRFEASKVFGAIVWAISGLRTPADQDSRTDLPDQRQQAVPTIEISAQQLSEVLPGFETFHVTLKREMGSKLYPFGEVKSEGELARSILSSKRNAK